MINRPGQFSITASGFEAVWSVEPSNVATEILAGTGIIGFAIWIWLMVIIAVRLWKLSIDPAVTEKYRIICQAFLWSYILQILILQFNATFLRPYVWFHMGMCIAITHCMEHIFINKNRKENITIRTRL